MKVWHPRAVLCFKLGDTGNKMATTGVYRYPMNIGARARYSQDGEDGKMYLPACSTRNILLSDEICRRELQAGRAKEEKASRSVRVRTT